MWCRRHTWLVDEKLLSIHIGVAAGAAGYWFTAFWMKPILQYRELRSRVFGDLILYAQVVYADGLIDRMPKLLEVRAP